ncbi:MAG: hypothetical protein ACLFMV_13035 [Spirochaetaceae bacterium]
MQKIVFRVLVTFSLASALLLSCDSPTGSNSDGSGSGSGTGDGSGNGSGQSISYVAGGQQYVFTENLGAQYKPISDETCVIGSDFPGASAENGIDIYFRGNAAGTFIGPPDDLDPYIGRPWLGILIDTLTYYAWEDDVGCWFTIDVTAYGPVGGRIEGTFSGDLTDEDGNKIEVRGGTFSVTRLTDD